MASSSKTVHKECADRQFCKIQIFLRVYVAYKLLSWNAMFLGETTFLKVMIFAKTTRAMVNLVVHISHLNY